MIVQSLLYFQKKLILTTPASVILHSVNETTFLCFEQTVLIDMTDMKDYGWKQYVAYESNAR